MELKEYLSGFAGLRLASRLLWLSLALPLTACVTYKGYLGPQLPNHQVATVSVKAPDASRIPIFWIFPMNMLTWFAEDWYETSQNAGIDIEGLSLDRGHPVRDGRQGNRLRLTRFNSVKVMPGEYLLSSVSSNHVIDQQSVGDESCSSNQQSCTCPSKQDQESKDKVCTQTVTKCSKPIRVTARDRNCFSLLRAKPGRHYEVFRRDELIRVQPRYFPEERQPDGDCVWGDPYEYPSTDERTSTGSCS
jgi:hypothetical protein